MRLFTSSKLEKCRRNGKLRQKSLAPAHWHHSSVSLSDPCDCFARIFLLCREVEGRPGGSKTSASFLQVHLSPDKSHQQPAEGTAHLTVLETCTSISLSFRPLPMKAQTKTEETMFLHTPALGEYTVLEPLGWRQTSRVFRSWDKVLTNSCTDYPGRSFHLNKLIISPFVAFSGHTAPQASSGDLIPRPLLHPKTGKQVALPTCHKPKLMGLWSCTCPTAWQAFISRLCVTNSSTLLIQGTCFPSWDRNSSATKQFHQYLWS